MVIVRRETSIAGRLVQPVCLRCVQCHLSFVALSERRYVASATTTGVFANADARLERVLEKLSAESKRSLSAGLGHCPHCGFRFPYIEPPGRALLVGVRVAKGLVLGGVLGGIAGTMPMMVSFPALLPAELGAAVGAAMMAWGAATVRFQAGPAPDPVMPAPEATTDDPRVMTYEAWGQFLSECQARLLEPVKEWWYGRLGRRTAVKEVFVPMAFHDWRRPEGEADPSPLLIQIYVMLRRWRL